MTPRLVFRPQAESEILEARNWYEERRQRLGEAFAAAVDLTLAGILEHPLAYPRSTARRVEQLCSVFRTQSTFASWQGKS